MICASDGNILPERAAGRLPSFLYRPISAVIGRRSWAATVGVGVGSRHGGKVRPQIIFRRWSCLQPRVIESPGEAAICPGRGLFGGAARVRGTFWQSHSAGSDPRCLFQSRGLRKIRQICRYERALRRGRRTPAQRRRQLSRREALHGRRTHLLSRPRTPITAPKASPPGMAAISMAAAPRTAKSTTWTRSRPRIRPCRCRRYVRVTNQLNQRSIVVRVNDRGPFRGSRVIDVSVKAAQLLGFHSSGLAPVRVEYVGRAPSKARTTAAGGDVARTASRRRRRQPSGWRRHRPVRIRAGGGHTEPARARPNAERLPLPRPRPRRRHRRTSPQRAVWPPRRRCRRPRRPTRLRARRRHF